MKKHARRGAALNKIRPLAEEIGNALDAGERIDHLAVRYKINRSTFASALETLGIHIPGSRPFRRAKPPLPASHFRIVVEEPGWTLYDSVS